MKTKFQILILVSSLLVLFFTPALADSHGADDVGFSCVVLGAGGGPREDDISGYMLWPAGLPGEAIFLDAGTLTAGIRKADEMGNLWEFRVPPDSNLTREGWILRNAKAYLITHAHLDHIAAMVINSPVDSSKQLFGIEPTIKDLKEHIFNWRVWPNFGDSGPGFALGVYKYITLTPGEEVPVANTSMTVEGHFLAHDLPYETGGFLVQKNGYYVMFFGDTGPDEVQNTDHLLKVWERLAPLIRDGRLLGMFIEVAYPEGRPDNLLFGHFTPSWLMHEFQRLAGIVDPKNPEEALNDLTVVVTHIKPEFVMAPSPFQLISEQLDTLNDLGINFIYPRQGMRIEFRP